MGAPPTRRAVGPVVGGALVLALSCAPALSAQLLYGGHLVHAEDAFGGATGVGGRVGFGIPAFPIEVLAGAEVFFPGCSDACGLQGLSIDGNFALPIPILAPYATGGWVLRRFDPVGEEDAETSSGLHLGVGISGGLAGAKLFGEARYEFMDAPEKQFILRAGFLIGG